MVRLHGERLAQVYLTGDLIAEEWVGNRKQPTGELATRALHLPPKPRVISLLQMLPTSEGVDAAKRSRLRQNGQRLGK